MLMDFIKRLVLSLVVALGAIGITTSSAFTATLTFDSSGLLNGATGVVVGGSNYNVTFIEDTCINAFDGCDQVSDFTFQTAAGARLASQALLDQVLLGAFDTSPELVAGYDSNLDYGFILTPYDLFVNSARLTYTQNRSENLLDAISPVGQILEYGKSFVHTGTAYAKWTEVTVSAVPLPAALPLYGAGIAVMGFIGWRKKRNA
ncbi:hypothetical protein A9Q83_04535 [Alphaproteobacteria bacterium 46_93_T64]|nr:hypothetical protein A9Q83_04535 [Alphaproteobacteria bacterium 46_93_T64]